MPDDTTDSESIIRVMPDRLANKIAAGEVVQRPASVAKELIENAIDAGASDIQLILKDAGSTLVQVIDDGCGMSPSDAVRCFRRHATSKIRSVDDLERIRTLGFRGEALASIAAVAQVELKTKRVEDEAGYRVCVDGGEVTTEEPCATPSGTSVAVRNLFYNVPARRNFLKTPATEFKHLTETFQFLALSNSDVAFTLVHKGNEIYNLSAAQADDFFAATRQRVVDLLGTEYEGRLLPVEDASSYLSMRGFIGQPEFNRKTRGEQFLFVNGRYVKSRYLSHAVRAAYDDLLPEGAFPFFALFLKLDPRRVDVNVHPTKAEVKFDDKSGVYGFVRSAVRQALGQSDLTPQFSEGTKASTSSSTTVSRPSRSKRQEPSPDSGTSQPARPTSSHQPSSSGSAQSEQQRRSRRSQHTDARPGDLSEALYRSPDPSERASADAEADTDTAARKQPLWALHDTYILTPTEEGLMLVDQRAAHERVLYERALRDVQDGAAETQQLLFPRTVELPTADVELFEELLPHLRALGFDVDRLSGRTVAVRGIPAGLRDGEEQSVLEDLLEQYKEHGEVTTEKQKRLAKVLAHRHAVRRGQPLESEERRALIDDLFACEMPYADPSGNPTMVKFSMEELAKRFGR